MIQLNGIARHFQVGEQRVKALDHIDLTIEQGGYMAIMGPSGSGKSTLLNMIGLLDRPTAGEYLLNGRETTALSDDEQATVRREQIGFVFQFFHLVPRLTARENIELPMLLAGIEPTERHQRANKLLSDYRITDRAEHRPDQLSGGQRQRVAIARATIMQPKIILADEPTGNLDRANGHEVMEIIERLNSGGITLIMVTHDPELGARAHEQIRIVDGQITEHLRR
ncbi:MAG: ABC transporter ATP-binding protein [Gammaproteobacteria bacterium]|nr:ABC transporter ATP-binding protein [Gammaproteobacteria bacterium]